jgi:hypothetical protein
MSFNPFSLQELEHFENSMQHNNPFDPIQLGRLLATLDSNCEKASLLFAKTGSSKLRSLRQENEIARRSKKRVLDVPVLASNTRQKMTGMSHGSSSSSSVTVPIAAATSVTIDWSLMDPSELKEARSNILHEGQETPSVVQNNAARGITMLREAVATYRKITSSNIYGVDNFTKREIQRMSGDPSDSMIGHLLSAPSPPRYDYRRN